MTALINARGQVLDADPPRQVAHEVWPRIWVGGSYNRWPSVQASTAVVAVPSRELWHRIHPGMTADRYLRFALHDGPLSEQALADAQGLARRLAKKHASGGTLAFRCYMGLNRSALLASLTRIAITGDSGLNVLAELRAARGEDGLCNPAFARAVAREGL